MLKGEGEGEGGEGGEMVVGCLFFTIEGQLVQTGAASLHSTTSQIHQTGRIVLGRWTKICVQTPPSAVRYPPQADQIPPDPKAAQLVDKTADSGLGRLQLLTSILLSSSSETLPIAESVDVTTIRG